MESSHDNKRSLRGLWQWGKQLIAKERCPHRLALSLAIGSFIAFSPLVGLHTLMVIGASWLLGLSMPLLFLISCGINNPWTMVPIYATDHLVGEYVMNHWGIDSYQWNPAWVASMNQTITAYTGLQGVSLWSFLIGGQLLASIVGIAVYVAARYVLSRCPAAAWQPL